TYKQLYDSIKPARIRSKEQCDYLINQVNLKYVEIYDLNASLQEKVLVITNLKDDLRKLKGKALVDNDVTKHPSDPEMLKIDVEPITPKLLNKKTTHSAYIKHTQEEAIVLRDLVEHVKTKYLLDHSLESACSKDIVNTIVNSSVDIASVNVHECEKCLKLETELLNKKDFVEKEIYDKLFKSFTTLEKHCISLEVDSQLNQEIFQRNNFVSNQSAPSFDQLFELNELKAQSQEKDTVIKKLKERIKSLSGKMNEDKIKKDLEEIETINIELDHRVSKLIAENEHLKQTYKQLYDSIKPARIRSKEQCDDLINQVNLKSVKISNLNASLQEKVLVITDLKDDLRKLKVQALVDNDVTKHLSDPEMLNIDVEPITPKLLNKKTAHSAYIKHTQEEATILRDLVKHVKTKYPQDHSLEFACRYAKLIQELLTHISKTCPSVNNTDGKLVAVTPKNKDKKVRFTKPVTSSEYKITKTASTSNLVSNKPMSSSTGVKPSTSACGSQPSDNTKKDKNRQTPRTACMQHSKLNANSELKCVKCNGCMLSDNHDLCVLDFINNVNARNKSKSVKQYLKDDFMKLKGKSLVDNDVTKHPSDPEMIKIDVEPITPKLLNKKTAHFAYIKHTQEEATVLKDLVKHVKTKYPLDHSLESACRYAKLILFDELTAMASEHSSSGPALHEMTPTTISSGLIPNPPPSTPFVPPSRSDWDLLFQPLFDELLTPPPSVDHPTPKVIAPTADIVALEPTASTSLPSLTTVDQDAPSPNNSQTTPETQSPIIPNDVEEDYHDIEVAHMGNDPYFGIPIPKIHSDQSLSSDSIHTIVHPDHQIYENNIKWTKDHPLENIIGELSRPVSTRLQLHEQALFCYYDAFLTDVEPKMYKDALTQSCWIEAMQEELNEFERLGV
ncbi:hypothetical protein Tco_0126726, partial [Tanacetum coccineum]